MKQYIVDAFTDKVFTGNPAAICILNKWMPDKLMMLIAAENNLSETAFAVKESETYHLRWFTPSGEIDLCGHATLACAYVLLRFYENRKSSITFHTLSGDFIVSKNENFYEVQFPPFELKQIPITKKRTDAIGNEPKEVYLGRDLLCVFDEETIVRTMKPDLEQVKKLDGLLLQYNRTGQGI